jgi:cytochrome c
MADRKTKWAVSAGALLGGLLIGCGRDAEPVPAADSTRGQVALLRYGCTGCHTIPGIASPGSNIGPPLEHVARRVYLAGVIANTPEGMLAWLRHPSAVDPGTAMPELGVTEADASDIAAYLATLD